MPTKKKNKIKKKPKQNKTRKTKGNVRKYVSNENRYDIWPNMRRV